MNSSLNDFTSRIVDLKADLELVTTAAQLRPRLGEMLNWNGVTETIQLAQRFMDAKAARPEGIYGPLLVRLMAVFERYLRFLIKESVEYQTSNAKSFNDLPQKLVNRNLILTGRILANLENPRDYLTFDITALIVNLATCKPGTASFKLNAEAFSATVMGVNPAAIDKALESIDITGCWDSLGSDTQLEKILGTKGARATGFGAGERLKELARWRNHLAHGGDEIVVSEGQLRDAIEFVTVFSTSLDAAVKKHLKPASKSH